MRIFTPILLAFQGAVAVSGYSFGSEYLPAVAGSFQCSGSEPRLISCQYTEGECCDDNQKAGVICECRIPYIQNKT